MDSQRPLVQSIRICNFTEGTVFVRLFFFLLWKAKFCPSAIAKISKCIPAVQYESQYFTVYCHSMKNIYTSNFFYWMFAKTFNKENKGTLNNLHKNVY